MAQWDKLNKNSMPDRAMVDDFVDNPLWTDFCDFVEEKYQAKPVMEYSRCSIPGWNVKYKKAGRSLCTLYPDAGGFTALVVISEPEKEETELLLPVLTGYLRSLYQETKVGMGQKWLMIEVKDQNILEDVKRLVDIRRNSKRAGKKAVGV